MPSPTKSSLLIALFLSTSYLLLSTCGQNPEDISSTTGEEIPGQTPPVESSEDLQPVPEAALEPDSGAQSSAATTTTSTASSPADVLTGQRNLSFPLTVAAGETVDIEFRQTLSSHTSQVGQQFTSRVTEPVRVGGRVAIPSGASIQGEVIEAEPAKKIGGRARLALEFRSLTLPSGATYSIGAIFAQAGKSQTGKDAAIIGGATVGGAILGKQVGGDTGTIIGAVAGGIGGAFAAKKTKGKPVEIPAGTLMILELTQPLTIDVLP